MRARFRKLGLDIPTVWLPRDRSGDALEKWAVIACDQYTSQPEYWREVEARVGDAPSTLRLIYPEAYLADGRDRVPEIQTAMRAYIEEGVLAPAAQGLVYIERSTAKTPRRCGLVVCVDLERYEYTPGNAAAIRATEETIADRLPPRMRAREGAALELPHILLLIDDPRRTVIEPLRGLTGSLQKLYDTDLMMNAGHIRGWAVEGEALSPVLEALEALADPESFSRRYPRHAGAAPLLAVVGDGNHSLACARECWLRLRETLPVERRADHPARYALVEMMNIHDEGLECEGIHRLLMNVEPNAFLRQLSASLIAGGEAVQRDQITCFCGDDVITLNATGGTVAQVRAVQGWIDAYLAAHPEASVDYIHGTEALKELSRLPGRVGLVMPDMQKHELFPAILEDELLPRKTFSLGEADEKRFYMECRRIDG